MNILDQTIWNLVKSFQALILLIMSKIIVSINVDKKSQGNDK